MGIAFGKNTKEDDIRSRLLAVGVSYISLAESLELYAIIIGRELTQSETNIYRDGWNAGRILLRGELKYK